MTTRSVWANPGEIVTVKLECERCESFRWPAVNPTRNILRGLKYLDKDDEKTAREFFGYALEELRYLAQHTDEKPQERPDGLDRAEAALRLVERFLTAADGKSVPRGITPGKHARNVIADYFGEAASS